MTNYEKIKKIIESGHIAQAYDKEENEYALFSSIQDTGNIRRSYWEDSIDGCRDYVGTVCDDENEIDEYNLDISVYQKPVRYPEVGDKVEILESVKQSPGYDNWNKEWKDMIGGPYEVNGCDFTGVWLYNKDNSNMFRFGYRHIAPRIHDEEEKQEETLSGRKITVVIDGKEYDAVVQ